MNVEDIPANELVKMTKKLDRLFRAVGCVPMCHNCKESIPVGQKFKIGTMNTDIWKSKESLSSETIATTREVLLCSKMNCTPKEISLKQEKWLKEYRERQKSKK